MTLCSLRRRQSLHPARMQSSACDEREQDRYWIICWRRSNIMCKKAVLLTTSVTPSWRQGRTWNGLEGRRVGRRGGRKWGQKGNGGERYGSLDFSLAVHLLRSVSPRPGLSRKTGTSETHQTVFIKRHRCCAAVGWAGHRTHRGNCTNKSSSLARRRRSCRRRRLWSRPAWLSEGTDRPEARPSGTAYPCLRERAYRRMHDGGYGGGGLCVRHMGPKWWIQVNE